MNELRPKVRSWPTDSSTPYVDRACVPSIGRATCPVVVSVHAKSGVGRQAAPTFAIVVKKLVADGMAIGIGIAVVFVAGMLIASRRVTDAETAPEKVTIPLLE